MADLRYFPSIPVSHWLTLRSQFKKSIPGSISSNYLSSILGMTETSAKSNILPGLRLIGLIDIDGKVNQDFAKKLRDDASYPQFCKDILTKLYPEELRQAFPDKDSNKDQVKTWLMNHTGIGDSAAYKIAGFYFALLEADPLSKLSKPINGKEAKTKSASIPKKSMNNLVKDTERKHEFPNAKLSNGPELNINIQIHISSDASADQIQSIFENMSKYLYKN